MAVANGWAIHRSRDRGNRPAKGLRTRRFKESGRLGCSPRSAGVVSSSGGECLVHRFRAAQGEAREREALSKDYFPRVMTIIIISGYFSMVTCFLLVPAPQNREFIATVLDEALGPCLLYAAGYYYGKLSLGAACKGFSWFRIFGKKRYN